MKTCTCFLFLCPSFNNVALQPLLVHDKPAAVSQNKPASACECGSLPKTATRQATKYPATAAGSGEFRFLWSLHTVITNIARSRREILLIEHKRPPFYRQKQRIRLRCSLIPGSAVLTALFSPGISRYHSGSGSQCLTQHQSSLLAQLTGNTNHSSYI